MKYLCLLVFCALSLSLSLSLSAASAFQTQEPEDTLRLHFDKYFREIDSLLNHSNRHEEIRFTYSDTLDAALRSMYSDKEESELKSLTSSTGLQVTGQAYKRLDGDVGLNDEDESALYSAKFQLGLEWNIMKSPLLVTRASKDVIRSEGEIALTKALITQRELVRHMLSDSIKVYYEKKYRTLLLLEKNNLYEFRLLYEALNSQGLISMIDLMDLINAQGEVEARLLLLSRYADESAPFSIPVFDYTHGINDSVLWRQISEKNLDLRLLRQTSKLISGKRDALSYWNDTRVSPFLRLSHYLMDEGNKNYKNNLDFGINLSFPIDWSVKEKRKTLAADEEINDIFYEQQKEELRSDVYKLVERYRTYGGLCYNHYYKYEMKKDFIMSYQFAAGALSGISLTAKLRDYQQLLEFVYSFYQAQEKATELYLEMMMLLYPGNIAPCITIKRMLEDNEDNPYKLYYEMKKTYDRQIQTQ